MRLVKVLSKSGHEAYPALKTSLHLLFPERQMAGRLKLKRLMESQCLHQRWRIAYWYRSPIHDPQLLRGFSHYATTASCTP